MNLARPVFYTSELGNNSLALDQTRDLPVILYVCLPKQSVTCALVPSCVIGFLGQPPSAGACYIWEDSPGSVRAPDCPCPPAGLETKPETGEC